MWRFPLVQAMSVWLLMAASMHAQQSIGEAMRHARAFSSSAEETQGLSAPPATLEEALHSLYQRAEIVFAGEVTSVEHTGDAVAVTFRVNDGIRSVVTGSTYVLREWAGLWIDDPDRYVVGERRLMLLLANSVCGFASPAGRSTGAIRLHGDAVQGTVDLRWVAAQLVVAATLPAVPVVSAFAKTTPISQSSNEADAVADHSAVDGGMVTGMLHAWQRAESLK